ncbi:MAG: type II and III secretion system protein family protein [Alphaproteobacteria bacterium]|nr:type II and III secretion system protein family protein [Alphaproteobacteria bacterium]
MTHANFARRVLSGTATVALLGASVAGAAQAQPSLAPAPAGPRAAPSVRPSSDLTLSVGTGRMVRLDGQMTDLFVANDAIADVQVRSNNQIYVFGKAPGETTVFATDKGGRTIFSANVRVGTNMGSLDELLRVAMPEAQIRATPVNGIVLLTGTVAAPADVEEATRLVQGFVGANTQVISRLKTATPLQVTLKVTIAEVSRTLVKEIGMNLLSKANNNGGFLFGASQGNPGTITYTGALDPVTNRPVPTYTFNQGPGTTLVGAGHLLGLDILSTLKLNEQVGAVHTLAEPNLTALSGETASFLAGGEFPIPTSSGLNGVSVEFKQYGVSLAFTPTVLEDGRISMRVRPEVSELSDAGAIQLNGFSVPSLTTRRAETTVELGSGQSFMIGGLLRNSTGNTTNKAPLLGSLPIIGALFKSNAFKRNETELVIVITPYLVRPVNANQIALPTDNIRNGTALDRVLLDQNEHNATAVRRPVPTMAPPQAAPGIGSAAPVPGPAAPAVPKLAQQPGVRPAQPQASASAAPGFSF